MPTLVVGMRIAKKTPEHAHDKRGHGTDSFPVCAEYKTLVTRHNTGVVEREFYAVLIGG